MRALAGKILTTLLTTFTLVACGSDKSEPADLATAYCELLFSCDCSVNKYADVTACVTDINTERDKSIAEAKAIADANGLIFDQACLDRFSEVPSDLTCNLEGEQDLDLCDICSLVHGDQPKGAACTEYEYYSDCADGLACYDGTCYSFCFEDSKAGEGEDCSFETCGEDLYCHFETRICEPTAGLGGACLLDEECSAGLHCAEDSTCQPLPGAGQPCTVFGNCAEGLECRVDSTCQPFPKAGEPCDYECADDLICDGTCKPPPGDGEPCPEYGLCAEGHSCDDATNLCTADDLAICSLGEPDEPVDPGNP